MKAGNAHVFDNNVNQFANAIAETADTLNNLCCVLYQDKNIQI